MKLDYLGWNNLLSAHFFNPAKCGTAVHLYANEELVTQLGRPYSSDIQDLVQAAKIGPPWVADDTSFCQKAYQAMVDWRQRDSSNYPPYIGYLVIFAAAAAIDHDFGQLAYHKPLRKLLNEPLLDRALPHFTQMQAIWKDLEQWSNIDVGGTNGIFNIDSAAVSIWKHVGIPISQTLLTDAERNGLKTIFADAAIDASAIPSDAELTKILLKNGPSILRRRTLIALASNADRAQVLLSLVRSELRSWDGEVLDSQGGERMAYAAMRLTCDIDRTSLRVNFGFRCKSNSEFPEEELNFSFADGTAVKCMDYQNCWSTPLIESSSCSEIKAQTFDWTHSFQATDKNLNWRTTFSGSPVKIMIPAIEFSGFMETKRVPRVGAALLAVHISNQQLIEAWGRSECDSFNEIRIVSGMPINWKLYEVSGVRSDNAVRDLLPQLAINKSFDLTPVGGIKVSRGNQFFPFAIPSFEVTVFPDVVRARCLNDEWALTANSDGLFNLGRNVPLDKSIEIEAKAGNDVAHTTLMIVSSEDRDKFLKPVWLDGFGRKTTNYDEGALIAGARCLNVSAISFSFGLDTQFEERMGFLLGRQLGQIVKRPAESMPTQWKPIWFVQLHPFNVEYCGDDIENASPEAATFGHESGNSALRWKHIFSDKELSNVITYPALQNLWQEYKKFAERL